MWLLGAESNPWLTASKEMGTPTYNHKELNLPTSRMSLAVDSSPEPPDKGPGWRHPDFSLVRP